MTTPRNESTGRRRGALRLSCSELERCIDVVIAKIKQHPDAMSESVRLRIEAHPMRLLNIVVRQKRTRQTRNRPRSSVRRLHPRPLLVLPPMCDSATTYTSE